VINVNGTVNFNSVDRSKKPTQINATDFHPHVETSFDDNGSSPDKQARQVRYTGI